MCSASRGNGQKADKRMRLYLVLLVLVFSQDHSLSVSRCPPGLTPSGDWTKTVAASNFTLAEVRPLQRAKQQTTARICYTDTHLFLRFDCVDDNPTSSMTKCNEPLYKEHVAEVFLTQTFRVPPSGPFHKYLELEINPNGALFAAHITNPNLDCPGIVGDLIQCSSTGISWEAHINREQKQWWAFLKIPFSLLNGHSVPISPPVFLKGNFFRIDTPKGSSKEYSAWSSPASEIDPCFHYPKSFGLLALN